MAMHVDEREDFQPVCPYCELKLYHVLGKKLAASLFSRRLIYCCPNCKKVLGVSHRKGLMAQ